MPIIASMKFIREETLYQWARLSLDTIVSLRAEMDLSPITQCSGFGEEPLARRLSFVELCLLILRGKHITTDDRISIYMTCSKHIRIPLLKCYETVHRVKRYVYQKYIY